MSIEIKKHYVAIFDNLCTDDVIMRTYYDTEKNAYDAAWKFSSECSVCSEGNFEFYVSVYDIDC